MKNFRIKILFAIWVLSLTGLFADSTMLVNQSGSFGVFLCSESGEILDHLMADIKDLGELTWSDDKTEIIYSYSSSDGFHLYTADAEGKNRKKITEGYYPDRDPLFLPDGRILFTRSLGQGNSSSLFLMDRNGGTPVNLS